ncbi:hypothetical protein BGX30_006301 [Mortierella sp. GBA39]|nr:hypothetical protein BGX30_006301 [Mortierella sp. GBA39]
MQWLGYLTEQPGQKHLIHTGYAFQEGAAGLEKTLEPLLRGMGPTTAYYTVDGSDQPIPGTGIRIKGPGNAYYPLKFRTTVDLELQRQIEQLAKESGMKEGAVVLLDAQTADVVAMVSLPFYNPLDVNPQQRAWNNRALQAAVPGSIFKTVIAAAALEAGVTSPDETFTCNGAYGKYGLSCPKEHGVITLAEAYAESCNAVFAELAERLSAGEIEAAAHKLGLGRTVGWEEKDILGLPLLRPFDHEDSGKIFADPDKADRDGGIRAQTGIGQRDVQVTPLQAANMIVTLLQQGQVHAPRILESVSYANGQLMKELKPHLAPSSLGTVQPATADLITGWMEKVVTEGTGQSIRGAAWPLAGKSGTAQVTINGQPRNHQWFIGIRRAGGHIKRRYVELFLRKADPALQISLLEQFLDQDQQHGREDQSGDAKDRQGDDHEREHQECRRHADRIARNSRFEQLAGEKHHDEQDGKADRQTEIADNKQINNPWDQDNRNPDERQNIKYGANQGQCKLVACAQNQQSGIYEHEGDEHHDQLGLDVGADGFQDICLQKCVGILQRLRRLVPHHFSPAADFGAEEKRQDDGDAEVAHKGRERTEQSDHIFKESGGPPAGIIR